ncbi:hypothetical protein OG730_41810 (plasmid) [Streptomyces sp. NBC_01298]|uniref:hypothetical protein n=1 Tax=Streptomyces sp. NBC_01298 TaxID=2903817 RepID=UPI002E105E67|nr:hypothetical protein OG730_41810 [Streptomyces sp. NBC_01298]
MRPERFREFAESALAAAPGVAEVQRWDGRPLGLAVTLTSGSRVWIGITGVLNPGAKHRDADVPVAGEAPTPVAWPQLYDDQQATTPELVTGYLAAAIVNSGNHEIREACAYGAASRHPGFGAAFHNEARAFCLITHTARAGQNLGPEYRLQSRF